MIRLLKWLVLGHVHKWKEDQRVPVKREYVSTLKPNGTPYYRDVIRVMCTCQTCGLPRSFDL